MWDCPVCGCLAITPDITFCPQCFKPRSEPGRSLAQFPSVPAEQSEASSVVSDATNPDAPQAPQEDGWGTAYNA